MYYTLGCPNKTKLTEMIDDGLASKETLFDEMLQYLSDDDVGDIMDTLGLNEDEDDGWNRWDCEPSRDDWDEE